MNNRLFPSIFSPTGKVFCSQKLFHKTCALLANFSLFINLFLPYLAIQPAYAQSADPTPTPTPVVENTPTPVPELTIEPTVEPTVEPTPKAIPTEIISVPEITPTIIETTPTAEIIPTSSENNTNPNNESASPPASSDNSINQTTPTPTPTTTVVPQILGQTTTGEIETAVVPNDSCRSDLLNPTLSTDKPDYHPVEIAIITGHGFLASTIYTIKIFSTDEPAVNFEKEIASDADGSFTYSYQLDGNYRPNYKVEVKFADVVVSSTTFTDAANLTVNGKKFNDINGDGTGTDEPGLSGWTIQGLDSSNNVYNTTTTDSSGNYSLSLGKDATFTVCEVSQSGWSQTFPTSGTTCPNGTMGYSVTSDNNGGFLSGKDFGNKIITVTGITVKTPPTKVTYNTGDLLDLSGLVVTINKQYGSVDVAFADFTTFGGFTTAKANSASLTPSDTSVVITYGGFHTTSQAITVNAVQPVVNNLYISGTGTNEKIYATFSTNYSTVSKCLLTTDYVPFTYNGAVVELTGALTLSADGLTGTCSASGVDLSAGASDIGKIKVFIDYCTGVTCSSLPSATINATNGTILDNIGPTNVSLSYTTGLKNVLYTFGAGMYMSFSNFSDSGVGAATGTMFMESAPYTNGVCGTFTEVSDSRSQVSPSSSSSSFYSDNTDPTWYTNLDDGKCHRFGLSASDRFGNTTLYMGGIVMFDTQAPAIPNITTGIRSNSLAFFTWNLITSDNSGINHYEYAFTNERTDGISSYTSVPNTQDDVLVNISGYGVTPNWLHIKAIDNAGNTGSENIFYLIQDSTAPTISITNPDSTPAQSKTVTASVGEGTLTIAINASGVTTCNNTLNFVPYTTTTFNSELDNGKTICYKAVDVLDNTAYLTSAAISGIDKTIPVGGSLTMKTKLHPTGITVANPDGSGVYAITPALSMTGLDVFNSLDVIVTDDNLNISDVPVYIDGTSADKINGAMVYDTTNHVWNYANQTKVETFTTGSHDLVATFLDNAGNTTTLTARFITDNTGPVITLNDRLSSVDVVYGSTFTDTGATTDDGSSVTIGGDTITSSSPVGAYHIIYDAADSAGNHATQVIRTVNVIKKEITIAATVGQSKVFGTTEPSFYVFNPSEELAFTGKLGRTAGEDVGAYNYNLNDLSAGSNYSLTLTPDTFVITQATQTISFGSLTDKIFGDPDFDVSATGGASGNPVTFTASNQCKMVGDKTVHIDSKGSCIITAHQLGNTNYSAAPSVAQRFNIADITSPVISGTPSDMTVEATSSAGAVVSYSNPTAIDGVDGVVTVSCTPLSGSTFSIGTTQVTCSATDSSTNTSTTIFNVKVVDTTAPTINVVADMVVEATSSIGATATFTAPISHDDIDGNIISTCNQTSGSTFPLGDTTVTCSKTDTAGNTGTTTFTITVQDTTAPVITLGGIIPDIEINSMFIDPATATDNVDEPVSVTVSGSVNTLLVGSYDITYNAVDTAGNHAVAVVRTVNVVDTTKPTIVLNGANPITLEVHSSYADAGATVSDNYDVGLTVVTVNPVNKDTVGSYIVTYNVTDTNGNVATEVTRTVNVVDIPTPTDTPTSTPTPTLTPTPTSVPVISNTNTSSDVGGAVLGVASAPVCNDQKPSSAPKLLSAVAGANSVTLTWSLASDPTSYYLVTYGNQSGSQQYGNPNVGPAGTTSYTVKSLSGNTTYYFKVRAGNGCTPGDFSNELSATAQGQFIATPATDFQPGVLGTQTANTTPTVVITPTETPTPTLNPSLSDVLGVSTKNMNYLWWLLLTLPLYVVIRLILKSKQN